MRDLGLIPGLGRSPGEGKATGSLECEIRWALGSITMNKASGDNRISAELFKILKDYAVKVLYSVNKFGQPRSGQLHHTGKGQFSVQSQIRAMPKNVQTTV